MKKIVSCTLILAGLSLSTIPVLASENADISEKITYKLLVNGVEIDTSKLPYQPYFEGNVLMVPLRKVGEALGYKVDWDEKTGEISIDDEYIQRAVLTEGSAEASFECRLKVIDISRRIENSAVTVIYNGYTYVPAEFFEEFFNDVKIEGEIISISPSMCELQ